MATSMDDLLRPARPAGAYDDLLAEVLPMARERRDWQPSDGPLPSLFVSHGAPPTLDDPGWLRSLFDWGQTLPRPRGIVVVSAHWEDAPLAISATAASAPLYYDFGGFHPRYYTLQYATPDATALGRRVVGALTHGTPMHQYVDRGLDHGAFIPLMAMFPAADVPVVQVSMPSLDPTALLTLGQRLRALRAEGYLIVGSGFMTHSFAVMRHPELASHNADFDAWASDAVDRSDVDALLDYASKGPGVRIAHPTADHFVPLLLSIGASDGAGAGATAPVAGTTWGNSTRSLQLP